MRITVNKKKRPTFFQFLLITLYGCLMLFMGAMLVHTQSMKSYEEYLSDRELTEDYLEWVAEENASLFD